MFSSAFARHLEFPPERCEPVTVADDDDDDDAPLANIPRQHTGVYMCLLQHYTPNVPVCSFSPPTLLRVPAADGSRGRHGDCRWPSRQLPSPPTSTGLGRTKKKHCPLEFGHAVQQLNAGLHSGLLNTGIIKHTDASVQGGWTIPTLSAKGSSPTWRPGGSADQEVMQLGNVASPS